MGRVPKYAKPPPKIGVNRADSGLEEEEKEAAGDDARGVPKCA
jgi:hypothetical protein